MSSTDTTNEITKKKESKSEADFYVKGSAYLLTCLTDIAYFILYLLIFGSVILFNCKIAQSGILSALTSRDSYCSPFINSNNEGTINSDSKDNEKIKNAIFSSARNMQTADNYIATDQISFLDDNNKYDIWGKIIVFDYVDNVVKGLGSSHGHIFKIIFGYDVDKNITILKDKHGNETYAGIISSFYSIVRSITSYDFYIINSIFTLLSYLPEALLFILPAMMPIYFTAICYFLLYLIVIFNIIVTVVFVIIHWFQYVKYMFFYFWDLTDGWPFWKVFFFSCSSFILLLIFGFLIFIVFIVVLVCYAIVVSVLSNVIILYVLIWPAMTFKANLYKLVHSGSNTDATSSIQDSFSLSGSLEDDIKKLSVKINSKNTNDPDKLELKPFGKSYTVWTVFVQNMYYKMNWIVLALTIIMLINVGTNFSVSGINIVLIIIFFIFVVTITARNERVNEVMTGKLFGVHKYSVSDMIAEGLIPITSDYTSPYHNNYKCNNTCLGDTADCDNLVKPNVTILKVNPSPLDILNKTNLSLPSSPSSPSSPTGPSDSSTNSLLSSLSTLSNHPAVSSLSSLSSLSNHPAVSSLSSLSTLSNHPAVSAKK